MVAVFAMAEGYILIVDGALLVLLLPALCLWVFGLLGVGIIHARERGIARSGACSLFATLPERDPNTPFSPTGSTASSVPDSGYLPRIATFIERFVLLAVCCR